MKQCDVARDLMTLWADELASEASVEQIQSYLEGCESCRKYWEGLNREFPEAQFDSGDVSKALRRDK